MSRRIRIAAFVTVAGTVALASTWGCIYLATRHVRPFYERALQTSPEELRRGRQELESRATALYSDARQRGQWRALFTADQINGWLATQLSEVSDDKLPSRIRDPRVAIAPELLTLGFLTCSAGLETVVTVEAAVFLTAAGEVAIRLVSVRAGALPLPVMQLADEIASVCRDLELPVRWTQQDGLPVAMILLHSDVSNEKRQFYVDTIKLGDGELFVEGHTEFRTQQTASGAHAGADEPSEIELADYELRLVPSNKKSTLEIARRNSTTRVKPSQQTTR